jgi:hypothetical protein
MGEFAPSLIDDLERWVLFGARWRVVSVSDERAVVDLCTCTGELVERRESENPTVIGYLRAAQADLDAKSEKERHR